MLPTMVSTITAPAKLLSLISKKPQIFTDALTIAIGLIRGYSLANLKWMCKQSVLESAASTSNVFQVCNNAWGMNAVTVRKTTQEGIYEAPNGEKLGVYPTLFAGALDRFYWDDYWGYSAYKRNTDYAQIVSNRYHESTGYAPAVDAVDNSAFRTAFVAVIAALPVELIILKMIWNFSNH